MTPVNIPTTPAAPQALVSDVRQLIESSRAQLASAVNSALTLLYWQIGQRIRNEVLQGERAEYGEQIVATLASQLEADYGRGFSGKNLRHMLRFAEAFPQAEIVSALRRQLSSTCAGWPNTSRSPAKPRPWASSCAAAKSRSRSSCWSWTPAASTSPNT